MRTARRRAGGTSRTVCLQALVFMLVGVLRGSAAPVGLRVSSRANPLGVETSNLTLSWRSDDTGKNWIQSAYRIEVASDPALLAADRPDIWDSARVTSNESIGIPYLGQSLGPASAASGAFGRGMLRAGSRSQLSQHGGKWGSWEAARGRRSGSCIPTRQKSARWSRSGGYGCRAAMRGGCRAGRLQSFTMFCILTQSQSRPFCIA